MSTAVVLAIVIASSSAGDPATDALRAAAVEALGSDDAVVMREVERPSDSEALRIERREHAQTVAEVVWLDDARTRARVRVHVLETDRWTERVVAFNVVDTPVERGRALGFALTSMLPEEALAANPHRRAPRSVGGAPDDDDLRSALRLGAAGSTGTGGGIGGSLAGEVFVNEKLLLRLGFAIRQVTLPGLTAMDVSDATDLTLATGVGVAFWPLHPGPDRRLAAGLRVDVLGLYHGVSRDGPNGDEVHKTKWLPAVDALAEVAWNVLGAFEIITSLGIEAALGRTRLAANNVSPGGLPLLRGVAEVGIRLSF